MSSSADATIAVSIHGPAGVLDLVVPAGATSVDVAREYAKQAEIAGHPAAADRARRSGSTRHCRWATPASRPGDVLVATTRRAPPSQGHAARGGQERPGDPGPGVDGRHDRRARRRVLAAWYAGRAGEDVGPHGRRRDAPGLRARRRAAARATPPPARRRRSRVRRRGRLRRALRARRPPAARDPRRLRHRRRGRGRASGARCPWTPTRSAPCGSPAASPSSPAVRLPALLGWDARVAWTLLVFLSMMAARFAPSLAIDVPDEALLDLDRLAVTAWSARDTRRSSRRGRIVVGADAMERLVHRASRIVTGASVAILVTVRRREPAAAAAAPRSTWTASARGAWCSSPAARCCSPHAPTVTPPRGRCCASPAWAPWPRSRRTSSSGPGPRSSARSSTSSWASASSRWRPRSRPVAGWRSVWWSRRAEVAESLCGSFAFAAAVVAAGVFRRLWELTS